MSPATPATPRTRATAGLPASRTCRDGLVLTSAADDGASRWRPGERLEQLFEERCKDLDRRGRADALAVDGPDTALTYRGLDARANQLARFLGTRRGIRAGDRVGLLFEHPVDVYVGMLAVLKLRASYVPLDPGFPADRLAYIAADAGVSAVLSCSRLAPRLAGVADAVQVLCLDELDGAIAAERDELLRPGEAGEAVDDLCYVIYTSGTTGRPKGVAVAHASICSFVRVAAEVYGIAAEDRVYQGLTIAFDFSVEEIWVAWMVGATPIASWRRRGATGARHRSALCRRFGMPRRAARKP